MKLPLLTTTVHASNRLNWVLLATLIPVSYIAAISVNALTNTHEITRLVPPYLEKPVKVGWNQADSEYLEGIGLWFAEMVANVTPRNATFVADRVSSVVSTKAYPAVRQKILQVAENPAFRQNGGAVHFEATSVVSEKIKGKATGKVFVLGQVSVQTYRGKETSQQVIELDMRMDSGRPWIDDIDHYEGTQPHTQAWLQKHPTKAKEVDAERLKAAASATPAEEETAK